MGHTIVKYKRGGDFEHEDLAERSDDIHKQHLYAKGVGDGEFTACGNSVVDYDHVETYVQKGRITCQRCLEVIKYYKSIKL